MTLHFASAAVLAAVTRTCKYASPGTDAELASEHVSTPPSIWQERSTVVPAGGGRTDRTVLMTSTV
jgi:hypothetical protein